MKHLDLLTGLTLDRGLPAPLHRQLADAVRLAMRTGSLRGGSALPSTRRLAAALGVSPVRTFSFEDPDGHALYGNDPR